MKRIFFGAWLAIGLCLCAKSQNQLRYTVEIDSTNWRDARVEITFESTNDTLYMIPGGTADIDGGRAAFVKNLQVKTSSGQPVVVNPQENGRWILGDRGSDEVVVSYEMTLNHEQYNWSGGLDGTAYLKDWGVFYACRTLFIFPAGSWQDIQLSMMVPADWKVTTPWHELGSMQYSIRSLDSFQNGMFFAGMHEELTFKREGFELVFALGGPSVIADREIYEKLAGGILDYYSDLMGGIPYPAPSNPFSKAVVILNEHDQADGEVLGTNISILVPADDDPMNKMIGKFIFAHEFFHLWNGKSIMPENPEGNEWFKEGVTNFYTLKALYSVGTIDEEEFFDLLDQFFYQRYVNDPLAGSEPLTRGDLKHDHWGLEYVGGMLAGMAIDLNIREHTSNQQSLDDLMRALFEQYAGTADTYSLKTLQSSITQLCGLDMTAFFDQYVKGADQIPIEDYFVQAGLEVSRSNGHLMFQDNGNITGLQQEIRQGFLGN